MLVVELVAFKNERTVRDKRENELASADDERLVVSSTSSESMCRLGKWADEDEDNGVVECVLALLLLLLIVVGVVLFWAVTPGTVTDTSSLKRASELVSS